MRHAVLPCVLAALVGVAVWAIAMLVIPRREPWDSGLYWAVFYPLSIFAAAALSHRYPGTRT